MLKDRLKKISKPVITAAAIVGSALIGEGKTNASPEPVSSPAVQAGWTWDKDDKINGFTLAPTNGLKVIQGSISDALDPDKKYRDDNLSGKVRTVSVGGYSDVSKNNSLESSAQNLNETYTSRSISSSVEMAISKDRKVNTGAAVIRFSNSEITNNLYDTDGQTANKTTDKIDGGAFLLTTQSDRLNLQQWCQDSINGIIQQKGDMDNKLKALQTLGHVFYSTLSPALDKLPNPNNVQARSGQEDIFNSMYQQKLSEIQAGEQGVSLSMKGLKPSKTYQSLSVAQLKSLMAKEK